MNGQMLEDNRRLVCRIIAEGTAYVKALWQKEQGKSVELKDRLFVRAKSIK